MEQMLELTKFMQEEMRTHGTKDAEPKAVKASTKTIRDKLNANLERQTILKPRETENKADLEGTEATNLETNPEKMQSEVEHREVPMEEAAVKSSETMKKRHRGRHLAAGRRGEPKELARGDCGSRRKLAAACRKVSRRSVVA
jgi:hypothetical protein